MPLNHADVALMMQGLAAPGNAAMEIRAQQEQERRNEIEETLRNKQLAIEQRRLDAERSREQTAAEPRVAALLRDDSNPNDEGIPITGTYDAIQKTVDLAKQKGKSLSIIPPTLKSGYSQITIGGVTLHPRNEQEHDAIVAKAKEAGIDPFAPKQPPATYGPVQADKAASSLEEMADMLESNASQAGPDSVDGQIATQKAQKLRERAKFLRHTPPSPDEFQTVKETTAEQPEVPPSSGFLGIGASPGQPFRPATTTERKVRVGQPTGAPAPAPVAGAAVQPGIADPELNAARQAITQGKDPVAVAKRYQQRTGKPFPAAQ